MRIVGLLVLAACGLVAAAGPRARPATAQMGPPHGPFAGPELGAFYPADGCGSLGALRPGGPFGLGTFTCLFDALPIAGDPADPGIITITVVHPPDVTLVSGYVADQAGHVCDVTAGAGTQALTLTCPNGLESLTSPSGLRWGPTGSVTLEPGMGSVTVGYSASPVPQPDGSVLLTPLTQRWGFPGGGVPDPMPAAASMPTLPAGWNLVGGPINWNVEGGLAGSSPLLPGPFYTFQAGDSDYKVVPADTPLPAGVGVWAYIPAPMPALSQPLGQPFLFYVTLPLPARHRILIANPSFGPAEVTGADLVYTYDPGVGSYQQSTTLQPGQGAWAWSTNGGTATVSGTCFYPPC